jgi:hypothetical protein
MELLVRDVIARVEVPSVTLGAALPGLKFAPLMVIWHAPEFVTP